MWLRNAQTASSSSTERAASVAVKGFVIDAIRNGVSARTGSRPPSTRSPAAATVVSPARERPAATPGTPVAARAS